MRTFSLPTAHWRAALDYHAFCQCTSEYHGNFYEFIPQDGGDLAISFGDLPAAGETQSINVPCLQALIRGLSSTSDHDLAGLARELNGTLYLLGPSDLCAPWFYARVDPSRRQLTYVNAGHETPLLIRARGPLHRIERTGAALGLSTRGLHRQESLAIEAGDVLAIFSDAVPEDVVTDIVTQHREAGAAELTARVLERVRRIADDCSFAVVRLLGAARHPLLDRAETLALCAA